MKRLLIAATIALVAIVPFWMMASTGALASAPPAARPQLAAAASGAHCPNYRNGPNCYHVPPSGKVNTTLCGIHLVGTAQPYSTITCSSLPLLLKLCPGGSGQSISIHGTDLDLTVPGAQIYKFDPSTGTSYLVSAITGSGGEYTIVYGAGTCAPPLPVTGGGALGFPYPAPGQPGPPWLPLGIGIGLFAFGAAILAASRKPAASRR